MSVEALKFYPETERPEVNVASILRDNRSEWADEARTIWLATRDAKNLKLVAKCGDARVELPNPDTVIEMSVIGTGEPPKGPLENILVSPGINGAVVMGHYDGEQGIPLKGCGGLAAKENQLKNPAIVSNLDYFINNNISHPDPIVQSLITGTGMLEYTRKPILIAAQDHRTSEIVPIAAIHSWGENKGSITAQNVVLASLRPGGKYDPETFYENGIPSINDADVPEILRDFLYDGHEKVKRIKDKFPTHYEDSKIQDPVLIDFSTSSMPLPTRLPELGGRLASAFGVFVSRKRVSDDEVEIHPEELMISISQIELPITQSLNNHGQVGKSFARTNTILIDTENFSVSRRLAIQLVATCGAVRTWAAIEGHKIIISKTTDGVITRIEEFRPNI